MSDVSFKLCNPSKPQISVHFCQTSLTRQKATMLWKTRDYLQGGSVLSTLLWCFEGTKGEHVGFFLTVCSKGSWITDSHPIASSWYWDCNNDRSLQRIALREVTCRSLYRTSILNVCMKNWKFCGLFCLPLSCVVFLCRYPNPEKCWNDIKSAKQYTQDSVQWK